MKEVRYIAKEQRAIREKRIEERKMAAAKVDPKLPTSNESKNSNQNTKTTKRVSNKKKKLQQRKSKHNRNTS